MTDKAPAEQYRKQLQSIVDGKKTVVEVAKAIGKTRVTVYRYLKLLGLGTLRVPVSKKRRAKRRAHAKANGARTDVHSAVAAAAFGSPATTAEAVVMQTLTPAFQVTEGAVTSWIDAKSQSDKDIVSACTRLANMLIEKNRAYGDAALSPLRVFSKSSPTEQINVRIDDKLNRLLQGHVLPDESLRDTRNDLMGYLVLMEIAERRAGQAG